MSSVLVTGAAGHVGATLVRALLGRGQVVRALVHTDRRAVAGLDMELVDGDVQDIESLHRAMAGVDVVYHAAARISILTTDRKQLEATNVAGTRHVVDACLEAGVRRLVHFSSVEALQPDPASGELDDSRPVVCSTRCPPYGLSKAAGEQIVRQAIAHGLDAIILNPTAIIGPNDYRIGLANGGLLALCRGRLLALVDAGFDWVDVRDVVDGALQAAERAPAGAQYVLAGHWASMVDLARLAHDINGARVPGLVVPMWAARLGAPLLTAWSRVSGQRPLYTTAGLFPLVHFKAIRHERATRELGYRPRPLRQTVADTWDWFECGSAGKIGAIRTG